ncbi:MAG: type II secretion system F family protein [Propionibacteriaceae bacterium]|nr:type II secretion system F family protein [Propionibacteriaceae bacterium]
MAVILVAVSFLITSGILLLVFGLSLRPRKKISLPQVSWTSPLVRLGGLAVAGVVICLLTGWVVAIIVLPLAGLAAPYLFQRSQAQDDLAMMEAMEEWTRGLSGILTSGSGLEQALIASLNSTPAALKPQVTDLVVRLKARWTTPAALRCFAEDLHDPTGDLIVATLLLGAQRRGEGLTTILEDCAQSVAVDLRALRQVEADAAKPRATARWVTGITAVVLGGLFFTGDYVLGYKTATGQVIFLSLLGCYAAVLVWMKQIATSTHRTRLLGEAVNP